MPVPSRLIRFPSALRTFAKPARGLGHKAGTTLQAAAIERAARLTALAEQALLDPDVSINDRVRLDGAAQRARRDMQVEIGKREPAGPNLEQYLASLPDE